MHALKPDELWCRSFEAAVPDCDSHEDAAVLEVKESAELQFCAMCRLFGSTKLASRFKITDAVQTGRPKEPVRRDGVGIDRDTETARDQIKYDFETLEPGDDLNDFQFTMQLENVEDPEKALFYAMLVEFCNGVDVGGKRSRGLGRVKLRSDYKVRYFDPDRQYPLERYLEKGKLCELAREAFEADLRAAFLRYTARGQGGIYVTPRVA